ncbi:MAG: flagellar basal body-associated FliL family protein [Roseicyclus sp.]
MRRILLPLGLFLVGIGGGVAAGLMLGNTGSLASTTGGDPVAGPDSGIADTAPDTQGVDEGDLPGFSPASGTTEYVRLNNQFVVPIVRQGAVRSLVVMSLTLEVDAGQEDVVFVHEPRLRDAFLQVMFAHANSGGFDGSFTESLAMAPLREALSEASHRVLGDIVHGILIVDITRQDT